MFGIDPKQVLSASLQNLPKGMADELLKYGHLSKEEQLDLRRRILLQVAYPATSTKLAALVLSLGTSVFFKSNDIDLQKDIAGALLGGHVGYYSVVALSKYANSVYVATPLDESFVAALGGLIGYHTIDKGETAITSLLGIQSTENDVMPFQIYNTYTLLTSIIPLIIRAGMARYFDELYPLKVIEEQFLVNEPINVVTPNIMPQVNANVVPNTATAGFYHI
jgi:hypothetical protein